ncbi:beta-ketoacyl-ACP synthase II [Mucilaginibacter auburnensis]|uniref:3-oxoacyl-[acyl-carrier-protein] synthase 2 n=1 Tax=Mucilaginibacter auburnensis TaxID=1457233 RepID=A0A2H9VM52_9SPHI|nr:beta-ketoacyl-ACP synthase II [Mucilaginibacter auburnensis]PJJ79404.1 3-oxoacyl-[acyl-carrier-protein] synthase II [Mucilaginibacter auburnensis]
MLKRVVVTGIGALTPLGNDVKTFWDNAVAGTSGAGIVTRFDASLFRSQVACELKGYNVTDFLDRADIKKTDPYTQYAFIASDEAIKDSGFDFNAMNPFDVGVIWGSAQGGMETYEGQVREYALGDGNPRFNPYLIPKFLINMASGLISLRHGYMGINYAPVSACATSNTAIMDAFNYIRLGKAKIIVTGGSEAPISPASFGGFSSMKAMSHRNDDPKTASRPFDVNRDGFVMGEGAGALVLEEYEHAVKRGANIYAEVCGAAMTADAYHMTSTHPEGKGATKAMQLALEEAGITIGQLDYLNMHATSTPVGDLSETHAVEGLTGGKKNNIQINATKSMTGHLLGAAGAIEGIISILAIKNGIIPPTINTQELDPAIPETMNIVLGEAIEHKVSYAMSNTFGFGGHNGTVVFGEV